jgi:hypothetical protein
MSGEVEANRSTGRIGLLLVRVLRFERLTSVPICLAESATATRQLMLYSEQSKAYLSIHCLGNVWRSGNISEKREKNMSRLFLPDEICY